MTYRLVFALVGAAIFSGACSSAQGDGSSTEDAGADPDSEPVGDGDEVYLGTGSNAATGGNPAGIGGGVQGDGDSASSGGSGGEPVDEGDGDGPAGSGGGELGSGGESAGAGGESPGNGGSADSSGGAPSSSDCTPSTDGTFVIEGETVFDERTCLTWMRDNTTGDPYEQAVSYCDSLSLGGYDDWRIPTAGEVATIFKCDGMWPPIDDTVFNVMGDGIWTSTESGTIAGDLPKVCGAGQSSGSFYDFGQVGGQNTRCVRGTSDLPDRSDCKTNSTICQ